MVARGEMVALVRPGANKFHAKKITVDGITFDSRKEAMRWQELKLMERAGKIRGLRRQVRFELLPAFDAGGKHYRPTSYVADFVYVDTKSGEEVVEDCKGFRTEVYKLKAKMFAHKFGVSIVES